jgi:mRNA-degrading endonuclease RelE of RelBE toxin-antitoxin system
LHHINIFNIIKSLNYDPSARKLAVILNVSEKTKSNVDYSFKVIKDKLSGFENVYKIKLKTVGYRLAYEVKESEIVVYVISVGKRENNKVYDALKERI